MTNPVIEIKDLWFSYNGSTVLTEVSLTVSEGDFLAIIGPNGGGKTTLVKLMLGILKPARGTIRVLDRKPEKASSRVGYVPQDININKNFPVTALNTVLMGRIRGGGGFRSFSAEDHAAARRSLEQLEMWDLRGRKMGELSGGQRQRVFLARALVSNPELLILDEPTASIDTKGQTDFYRFLTELNQSVTVIVVSHDLMVLSSYAKTVACVSRNLHFHDRPEITPEMLNQAYRCPVELIAASFPNRILNIPTKE